MVLASAVLPQKNTEVYPVLPDVQTTWRGTWKVALNCVNSTWDKITYLFFAILSFWKPLLGPRLQLLWSELRGIYLSFRYQWSEAEKQHLKQQIADLRKQVEEVGNLKIENTFLRKQLEKQKCLSPVNQALEVRAEAAERKRDLDEKRIASLEKQLEEQMTPPEKSLQPTSSGGGAFSVYNRELFPLLEKRIAHAFNALPLDVNDPRFEELRSAVEREREIYLQVIESLAFPYLLQGGGV